VGKVNHCYTNLQTVCTQNDHLFRWCTDAVDYTTVELLAQWCSDRTGSLFTNAGRTYDTIAVVRCPSQLRYDLFTKRVANSNRIVRATFSWITTGVADWSYDRRTSDHRFTTLVPFFDEKLFLVVHIANSGAVDATLEDFPHRVVHGVKIG